MTRIPKLMQFFLSLLLLSILIACSKESSTNVNPLIPPVTDTNQQLPVISGKVVFHSYDRYGGASQMYIYDFAAKQLSFISKNWNIYDPMNAHFSPDGTTIAFMGEGTENGKWDIYICGVGSGLQPTNLTSGDNCRDEDPKFSFDGKTICFKQTSNGGVGNLKIMDLNGKVTHNVTNNTIESGMPYFTKDGTALIYARGSGSTSDIYMVNIDGTNNRALENINNLQEYYPITFDSLSFLYTRSSLISIPYDQVYKGNFSTGVAISLPFNKSDADYSDAFPCGPKYVILSSDRAGGVGAYDLYIADINSGKIWSLNNYYSGINSNKNELGACYSDK